MLPVLLGAYTSEQKQIREVISFMENSAQPIICEITYAIYNKHRE